MPHEWCTVPSHAHAMGAGLDQLKACHPKNKSPRWEMKKAPKAPKRPPGALQKIRQHIMIPVKTLVGLVGSWVTSCTRGGKECVLNHTRMHPQLVQATTHLARELTLPPLDQNHKYDTNMLWCARGGGWLAWWLVAWAALVFSLSLHYTHIW